MNAHAIHATQKKRMCADEMYKKNSSLRFSFESDEFRDSLFDLVVANHMQLIRWHYIKMARMYGARNINADFSDIETNVFLFGKRALCKKMCYLGLYKPELTSDGLIACYLTQQDNGDTNHYIQSRTLFYNDRKKYQRILNKIYSAPSLDDDLLKVIAVKIADKAWWYGVQQEQCSRKTILMPHDTYNSRYGEERVGLNSFDGIGYDSIDIVKINRELSEETQTKINHHLECVQQLISSMCSMLDRRYFDINQSPTFKPITKFIFVSDYLHVLQEVIKHQLYWFNQDRLRAGHGYDYTSNNFVATVDYDSICNRFGFIGINPKLGVAKRLLTTRQAINLMVEVYAAKLAIHNNTTSTYDEILTPLITSDRFIQQTKWMNKDTIQQQLNTLQKYKDMKPIVSFGELGSTFNHLAYELCYCLSDVLESNDSLSVSEFMKDLAKLLFIPTGGRGKYMFFANSPYHLFHKELISAPPKVVYDKLFPEPDRKLLTQIHNAHDDAKYASTMPHRIKAARITEDAKETWRAAIAKNRPKVRRFLYHKTNTRLNIKEIAEQEGRKENTINKRIEKGWDPKVPYEVSKN